jgi:predicted 3-demethylubiquinone-9 3-methyltransferase (glyoxalase superfamily)
LREAAVKLICMKKINAFLWFDSEAEEAAKFYVGIFKNSKISRVTHYPKDPPLHEATARQGRRKKLAARWDQS